MAKVEQFFGLYGLDVAMEKFDAMKVMFSGIKDWPDIEGEVTDFFMEKRRQAVQADSERQQQMDQAMVEGLVNGIRVGQANLLTGANSQAPYFSTSAVGGRKQ